ncbi:MAG: hypothetical protein AAB393_00725, partial [Bacteroidota bacterium]
MKLPSLSHLAHQSTRTFQRFPLTIVDAIIGTLAVIVMIEYPTHEHPRLEFLQRVALVAALGVPFFTTIVVTAEKFGWEMRRRF